VPFRRFQIVTNLSPEEACERLRKVTRRPVGVWEAMTRSLKANSAEPPFVGVVGTAFKIHRDIRYGNSFLPILRGSISPGNGKTIVKVWMTLPAFTVAFMLVWFAGVAFGAALALPALLLDHNAVGLVPIAMLAAGLAMVCLGFYPEARKAERVLRDALEEAL
jgi:hypothetical protein